MIIVAYTMSFNVDNGKSRFDFLFVIPVEIYFLHGLHGTKYAHYLLHSFH